MITKNELDKVFEPVGSSAGIFLFSAGLIITCFSLTGLIILLIGEFVGSTTTRTLVDHDKKRLYFLNNIFEIIPIGQWITIQSVMKIGIKKSNKIWRT